MDGNHTNVATESPFLIRATDNKHKSLHGKNI